LNWNLLPLARLASGIILTSNLTAFPGSIVVEIESIPAGCVSEIVYELEVFPSSPITTYTSQ
jgi:hypothetical protein